jgi:hypothetical protein
MNTGFAYNICSVCRFFAQQGRRTKTVAGSWSKVNILFLQRIYNDASGKTGGNCWWWDCRMDGC